MASQTWKLRPASIAIHGGHIPSLSVGSALMPLYHSSTYVAKSCREFEKKFKDHREGGKNLLYAPFGYPNTQKLEETYADVFYGDILKKPECVVTCRGMEAIALTFEAYLLSGDVVLYNEPLYGGTIQLLRRLESQCGIYSKSFQSADDLPTFFEDAYIRNRLQMIFLESPTNPTLREVDIEAIAAFVEEHNVYRQTQEETYCLTHSRPILVVVDNTFMTPYLQRPLAHGAHIEVDSATKYLGGHGDLIAGIVLGDKKYIDPIRARRSEHGGTIDALRAELLARSLQTLGPRMDMHCSNAQRTASFLAQHPKIEKLCFLGLLEKDDPQYAIHQKQCSDTGGIISFEIGGKIRNIRRFLDSLQMIRLGPSLGATHSLICPPALTIHSSLSHTERERMGIRNNLIRLSVGLEDPEDIVADLKQALEKV